MHKSIIRLQLSYHRRINLSNNSLTGTAPRQWSALVHLDSLDLRGNPDLRGEVAAVEGVFVQVSGTALQWDGNAHMTWARHRSRWESAEATRNGDDNDNGLLPDQNPDQGSSSTSSDAESWRQNGQCSFCRRLPANDDKCCCVRDCCDALGDRSLCSQ